MKKDVGYYASLPYTVVLEHWEDQGGYWVARYAELPYCMMEGKTPEEALKELQEELPAYIAVCLKDNLPIPEPAGQKYSGNVCVRMPPTLHKALAQLSVKEDVSLNQYMVMALGMAVGFQSAKNETAAKAGRKAKGPGRKRPWRNSPVSPGETFYFFRRSRGRARKSCGR